MAHLFLEALGIDLPSDVLVAQWWVAHVSYVTGGETAVRTLRQCQTRVLAVAGRRRDKKSNRQYRWTHVWQGELRRKQVDRPSPRRAISVDGRGVCQNADHSGLQTTSRALLPTH